MARTSPGRLAFSRWPFGRILKGDCNWDWHKELFPEARKTLPLLDLGLAALIQDLAERGLLNIAVVTWGEFGRTPRINKNAGRDHWPKVAGALVAGGGLRCGQVLGSTSRWGEEPSSQVATKAPLPKKNCVGKSGQCLFP